MNITRLGASRLWALALALSAGSASASLNFEVVGDVLVDRDTGYAWRQVVTTGFPASLDLGGGWRYASYYTFADMLPDPGTYGGGSGAAHALAYFDPTSRGSLGGWLNHGERSGYPLFDSHAYLYTIGSSGSVSISGWGPSTIGDYNAGYCTPSSPFAELCAQSRTFVAVNTEWPGAVPLPAAAWLLASGLAVGAPGFLRRRRVRG